jgi:hypothetical protein
LVRLIPTLPFEGGLKSTSSVFTWNAPMLMSVPELFVDRS